MPNRTTFRVLCSAMIFAAWAPTVPGAERASPKDAAPLADSPCGERPADLATLDIPQLVCHYITEDRDRAKLLKLIRDKTGEDAAPVVATLRAGDFWGKLSAREVSFAVPMPAAEPLIVQCRVPREYDPSQSRSLVVTWLDGRPMDDIAAEFAPWWSDEVGEPIIAVLTRAIDTTFNRSAGQGELDRVLAEIRGKFHVNDARIAIAGPPDDRRSTWLVAAANAGVFAALLAEPDYPELPYPDVTFPILADSLRSTRVFLTGPASPRPTSRQAPPANEPALPSLSETLARLKLPVRFLGGSRETNAATSARDASAATNQLRREAVPTTITHWFRFPEHGRAAWLWQMKFLGDPWEAEQISILPSPAVDRAEFIADVFKSQLAYIGGTVEGNEIRIETRRCAEIDVLLFDGMVDLTKPVVVTINGRRRFDRVVKPDITTLLSELVQSRDFQRLVVARIRFGIRSEAPDDAATPAPK